MSKTHWPGRRGWYPTTACGLFEGSLDVADATGDVTCKTCRETNDFYQAAGLTRPPKTKWKPGPPTSPGWYWHRYTKHAGVKPVPNYWGHDTIAAFADKYGIEHQPVAGPLP